MIVIILKGHSTVKWWLTCPPRASTMVRSRRETLTTFHREHLYVECIASNRASARIIVNVWVCQHRFQASLDIQKGLTAQKYIDEIIRAHVKPQVDNHALADSTVIIRGGTKTHSARISRDVFDNATSYLLSAKNPDISIIAKLWSFVYRNMYGIDPLP